MRAFERRQNQNRKLADEQIRKLSQEHFNRSVVSSNSQYKSSYHSTSEMSEFQIDTSHRDTSDNMIIELEGIAFRKNDETEFRRVVIQNFI